MEKRKVVITGMGCISPVGLSTAECWKALHDGVCGVAPITQYDTSEMKVKLGAEVKGYDPTLQIEPREIKHMSRFSQFAVSAACEAMEQSGLKIEDENANRCGVIVSSAIGGLSFTATELERCMKMGYDRCSPFYVPMILCNMAAGLIAIRFGFKGMCTSPVTACAGGTNALGDAFRAIRDGYLDVAISGGAESVFTPLAIGGFTTMRALYTGEDLERASIPFDKERSGFVMGEGAGILVLEELEHAKGRGASILGEVVGYGASCDAYHMTAPDPDGAGGAAAMAGAIADAGIRPEDVDYINAHGTSTPLNDKCETMAIKSVFGEHAYQLAVSSTKSYTGHMLGAAGAVEAIFSALALQEGYIPPTLHYSVPDPDCDLDVVPNVGRKADLRYALSNSLGFGGHNASILLKKWEAD